MMYLHIMFIFLLHDRYEWPFRNQVLLLQGWDQHNSVEHRIKDARR